MYICIYIYIYIYILHIYIYFLLIDLTENVKTPEYAIACQCCVFLYKKYITILNSNFGTMQVA